MTRPPRRAPRLEGTVFEPVEIYLGNTPGEAEYLDDVVQALREEGERRDRTNDELTDKVAQLMFENSKLNRGKKSSTRPPSTATEAFSALALVLLRHGVTEAQIKEYLADAWRLYGIPNVARQVEVALKLAKQRQAE